MAEDETKKNAKPESKAEPVKAPAKAPAKTSSGKLAVILIRNITKSDGTIRDTLVMLKLNRKFTCNIVENNPGMKGMLNKVKDFVTYGEVDAEIIKLLEEKRANKDNEGKSRGWYNLHPPRGGFERKGIKRNFSQGGTLGYRGAKMADLIKKML
ncbi:MAG: uL30 family ribosomal protein [Candidatus Woesearchaeota archaeon]